MQQALNFVKSNHQRYIEELKTFLTIPSISSDPERKQAMYDCAEHAVNLLKDAGIDNLKIHNTPGHPVVTGDWLHAPDAPTVLIYGHLDVQPVDPLDLWEKDPFVAHIQNDRLVARGTADDKGQLYMHVKALEAILKTDGKLPVNVKIILESEEEIGSVNLPAFLKANKEYLTTDIAVVSDSGMLAEGKPAITYGLKGLTYLEIELTGPNRDLHSGTFGGAVANPAEILARLLASVKDEKGRIQIPGFYDRIPDMTEEERARIARVPYNETEYMSSLGVEELWGEEPYTRRERTGARPTFEINGIWSGFTGVGAKTVLPSKAHAKFSMRLVPDQDPDEIMELVEKYFIEKAPKSVKVKFIRHHGGHPVVTPIDSKYMKAAEQALAESYNHEVYFLREGGSIPIVADFKKILGVDTLLLGFALPDARTHSPNENIHLPTFFTGIESLVRTWYYFVK
ncbi:MAG: dipeptidase [Candidatus Hatepunaea meridiana]|nr:dipeptidase [Candidatus Hatepunaea meridiana]